MSEVNQQSHLDLVLFYDGDCGFCQQMVRFALKNDRDAKFAFAPLNGATYALVFGHQNDPLTSVIVFDQQQTFREYEAVLRILYHLGKSFRCLWYLARLVPKAWGDWCYGQIAKKRKVLKCPLVVMKSDRRMLP